MINIIQWFEHVWRLYGGEMKEVWCKKLNKKTLRGRLRKRWLHTVLKDLQNIDETI